MRRRERAGGRLGWAAWGCVVAIGAMGCTAEEYVGPTQGRVHQMALIQESGTARDLATGLVEKRVEFLYRLPSEAERAALQRNPPTAPSYPRWPWARVDDVRVEVDWVLHNLSTESRAEVLLLFNGFNEFHEFVPWIVGGEGALGNFSQWERRVRLDPGERREGTIREDDVDEAARDLAILAMGAPNFNFVVHPETRGLDDPRLSAYRPEVVPALRGIRMALVPESAAIVLLEFTVRVRDLADRLAGEGDEVWDLPEPEVLVPPGLEAE